MSVPCFPGHRSNLKFCGGWGVGGTSVFFPENNTTVGQGLSKESPTVFKDKKFVKTGNFSEIKF